MGDMKLVRRMPGGGVGSRSSSVERDESQPTTSATTSLEELVRWSTAETGAYQDRIRGWLYMLECCSCRVSGGQRGRTMGLVEYTGLE